MIRFRHTNHDIPELNTASLPDLIFTVLFFFMIVTHMRQENVLLRLSEPTGKQLSLIQGKNHTLHLFIGQEQNGSNGAFMVQVGNKTCPLEEVGTAVSHVREAMSSDAKEHLTVVIKADRNTPMQIINTVKQQLRKQGVLKIAYAATETSQSADSD